MYITENLLDESTVQMFYENSSFSFSTEVDMWSEIKINSHGNDERNI